MIGTSATLKPFDFVSLRDLLYGLMLPSGNDAAVCLAENVGTHMYLSSEEYRAKKRQPYYDDSRDAKPPVNWRLLSGSARAEAQTPAQSIGFGGIFPWAQRM